MAEQGACQAAPLYTERSIGNAGCCWTSVRGQDCGQRSATHRGRLGLGRPARRFAAARCRRPASTARLARCVPRAGQTSAGSTRRAPSGTSGVCSPSCRSRARTSPSSMPRSAARSSECAIPGTVARWGRTASRVRCGLPRDPWSGCADHQTPRRTSSAWCSWVMDV